MTVAPPICTCGKDGRPGGLGPCPMHGAIGKAGHVMEAMLEGGVEGVAGLAEAGKRLASAVKQHRNATLQRLDMIDTHRARMLPADKQLYEALEQYEKESDAHARSGGLHSSDG